MYYVDLHADSGLFERLTKIEEEFPGANVILHKLACPPDVSRFDISFFPFFFLNISGGFKGVRVVRLKKPSGTKLFQFHGQICEKSGEILKKETPLDGL